MLGSLLGGLKGFLPCSFACISLGFDILGGFHASCVHKETRESGALLPSSPRHCSFPFGHRLLHVRQGASVMTELLCLTRCVCLVLEVIAGPSRKRFRLSGKIVRLRGPFLGRKPRDQIRTGFALVTLVFSISVGSNATATREAESKIQFIRAVFFFTGTEEQKRAQIACFWHVGTLEEPQKQQENNGICATSNHDSSCPT